MNPPNQTTGQLGASETLSLRAARARVCRLLESFGLLAGQQQDALCEQLVGTAHDLWRQHPGLDLVTLAEAEAVHRLGSWFAAVLALPPCPDQAALLVGRAAFLACRGQERWADLLLVDVDHLPAEFVTALREAAPQVTPPEAPETMVDQPYRRWSMRDLLWLMVPVRREQRELVGVAPRDLNSAS